MYKLSYKIDDNDYMEFNKYHFETTSMGKRVLIMFRIIIPCVCLMLLLLSYIEKSNLIFIIMESIVMTIISIYWVVCAKKIYFKSIKKNIDKLRKDGKLPYSSEGTIIFDDESIHEINSITETKTRYSSVEKIGVTESAIYIYFNSIQAYIVPSTCFNNVKEKQDFISFITSKVDLNKSAMG